MDETRDYSPDPDPRILALDRPEEHQRLIKTQWENLALFSMRHYNSEGRGAVLLDLRGSTVRGSTIDVPAFYVATGSEQLAKRGGWPDDVAELVDSYEPSEEVLFIVLTLDGAYVHYLVANDPPPGELGGG